MKFQSQFTGEEIELFLSEVEKLMNLNYEEELAFDTTEIVVESNTTTTAILGQAILGQMRLV